MQSWERLWAPHDEATYQSVLRQIDRRDRVLEIGAGDLRLARRIAERAELVHAIEIRGDLLARNGPLVRQPRNLRIIWADARSYEFPQDITAAVLLMRHCTHFPLYWRKLAASGCRKLVTNARWGFGVESIDLRRPRQSFPDATPGWYACHCGRTGFKQASPEDLDLQLLERVQEVAFCPACRPGRGSIGGQAAGPRASTL